MTNQEKFEACLLAAQQIVEAEKQLHPHCEGVVAVKVSGGVSNTDTKFARQGTTDQEYSYNLPGSLSSLLTANAQQATPNPTQAANVGALLSQLLTQNTLDVPGKSTINSILGLSPTSFDGASSLRVLAGQNPLSSSYETATEDAFKQRAGTALAQVQSGPSMVRGGTARGAMAQGEMATRLAQERGSEIRAAQTQTAGQVGNAAQLLNLIEMARRGLQGNAQSAFAGQVAQRTGQGLQAANVGEMQKGTNIGLLQMVSGLLGSKRARTTDDLTGSGSENRSFVQGEGGLSCCFIFLTALNGPLPWYVNLARKDLLTPRRKAGYNWMASLTVPHMRSKRWFNKLVNRILVRPFLRYGAYTYGASNKGWLWAPYCKAWLATWSTLGHFVLKGDK